VESNEPNTDALWALCAKDRDAFVQAMHLFLIKVQMSFNSILSIRGCCLLVNKKAFRDVGGFSNTILEDGDFAAKMKKVGYVIRYETSTSVKTDEPSTMKEWYKSRKRYGKGIFFCLLNHKRHFLLSKHSLLSFYPYPLVIISFILLSLIANSFSLSEIITTFSLAGLIALVSTKGAIIGSITTIKSIRNISVLGHLVIYLFLYTPIVTVSYLVGVISAINDKRKQMGELKLSDW